MLNNLKQRFGNKQFLLLSKLQFSHIETHNNTKYLTILGLREVIR